MPCIVSKTNPCPSCRIMNIISYSLIAVIFMMDLFSTKAKRSAVISLPTELKANALFHQAVLVATSHFSVYVEKIIFEKFYGP